MYWDLQKDKLGTKTWIEIIKYCTITQMSSLNPPSINNIFIGIDKFMIHIYNFIMVINIFEIHRCKTCKSLFMGVNDYVNFVKAFF